MRGSGCWESSWLREGLEGSPLSFPAFVKVKGEEREGMMYVFSQGGEIAHSDDYHDSTNILGYGQGPWVSQSQRLDIQSSSCFFLLLKKK